MRLDIRNRNKEERLSFMYLLFKDLRDKIRLKYTKDVLSDAELLDYLKKIYKKRYLPKGRFMNNVKNTNQVMNVEEFINLFLNSDYIMSGYACLFEKHDDENLIIQVLEFLGKMRGINKNKMQASEKGSLDYNRYKVLQLGFKVAANAFYGTLGLDVSIFFNSLIQNSVTFTGQDIISTSIIAMEDFLGNNCRYKKLDDVLQFIMNVKREKHEKDIFDYVDRPINREEVVDYLYNKCDFEIERDVLGNLLLTHDERELTELFYKNNLILFLSGKKIREIMNSKIKRYNEIDGTIGEDGKKINGHTRDDDFTNIVIDFTFYNYILDDRYRRALQETRNSVLICDTDSNFLYLGNHIQTLLKEYDLKETEKNELSSCNIYIDFCTEALARIYWTLTTNLGIEDEYKKIIEMKNEYLMAQTMMTKAKKAYAAYLWAEFGKIIDCNDDDEMDKRLDMKGISIRKSVIAEKIRDKYSNILFYDILKNKNISVKDILYKFYEIKKEVSDDIKAGNSTYLIPKRCDGFENYDQSRLLSLPQVRGVMVWNELEPEHKIILPDSINMMKLVSTKEDCPEMLWLKENYPDKYEIIMNVVFRSYTDEDENKGFKKMGFNVLATPKTIEKIPDYIIPFIDIESTAINNISSGNIMLESLAVHCINRDQKNYMSNIFKG